MGFITGGLRGKECKSFRISLLASYCHAVFAFAVGNITSLFLFNLSINTMHPMLNVAVKAARRAGNVINRASLNLERLQVDRKQHNDFVTEVDKAAEAAIIETLSEAYPTHGFLAEETGEYNADAENIWIIDPLDGTTNFIHGFPQYAVSIALAVNGVIHQAVVYDPTCDELFTATRGAGAYLDRRRLRVGSQNRLMNCLIGTGFPYREDQDLEKYLKIFAEMTRQCSGLRRPGAASLDLAYVAAGRYDGFFESDLKPWDMAAGALLITESGGLIGNYRGEEGFLKSGEVMAANPRIYAQMVQCLAKYSVS
jgi:myo-inositol-1(or 4)-monophosphatase